MTNYSKMYYALFNCISDALSQLEKQNYGNAREILIQAQQKAEERYMEEEESTTEKSQ